ncbi:proteasome regulatory particle base subunit [Irineochytrium annulatum]|nr:proteasome regulatory particle base subunit [Irineochytrium annulatum]
MRVSSYPSAIKEKAVVALGSTLTVSAQVESQPAPNVVFLTLKHEKVQSEVTIPLERKADKYTISSDLAMGPFDYIRKHAGVYRMKLIVAAPDNEPVTHEFGTVDLQFEPIQIDTTESYHTLPPISHVFRQAEKTPNFVISYTFVGVVLAPWLFLLGTWSTIGFNTYYLNATAMSLIFGAAFLSSLAVSLGLFFVYWWKLNLFEFLGCGALLWFITAVLGRQSLVLRAAVRVEDEAASVKHSK